MFDKNILAIDIGSYHIKAILGSGQKNSLFIANAITLKTPAETMQDGRIIDVNKLSNFLYNYLLNKGIKAKKVSFSISSPSVITREIVIPVVKETEMLSLIRYEIEQYLPIVMDEYDIEYKLLEEYEEEGVKKARVMVGVVPKNLVQSYLELAKSLRMTPYILDVNSNSAAKLISRCSTSNEKQQSQQSSIALIDIGYENINLSMIKNNKLCFNRLINKGSGIIDEGIDLREITLDNSEPEAETSPWIGTIDGWLEDIQRIFQYYSNRGSNKLDKVYLCGGGACIKGLAQYFGNTMGLSVELLKDAGSIKLSKALTELDIRTYINAMGLLIRK